MRCRYCCIIIYDIFGSIHHTAATGLIQFDSIRAYGRAYNTCRLHIRKARDAHSYNNVRHDNFDVFPRVACGQCLKNFLYYVLLQLILIDIIGLHNAKELM